LPFVLFSFTVTVWTLQESEKSFVFGTGCDFSSGRVAPQALFSGSLRRPWPSENVMQLDYVRREIERMRNQVHRQRGEIRQLQRAGISTAPAEALLERMLNKIDELCAERDRLKREQGSGNSRVLGGRSW
jgi:hypothetical protein